MSVLAEPKTRGVADGFFVVCDGLNALPDSVVSASTRGLAQNGRQTGIAPA